MKSFSRFIIASLAVIFFLGQQYLLLRPNYPTMHINPEFMIIQDRVVQYLGPQALYKRHRSLGYFFKAENLFSAPEITPEFQLIKVQNSRIFGFGENFQEAEIIKQPIFTESDVWVLFGKVPDILPLPNQLIIWMPDKKVPKKLTEKLINTEVRILSVKDLGRFELQLVVGQWELR